MTLRPARNLPRESNLMMSGLERISGGSKGREELMGLPGTREHILDALDFTKGGCEFSVWIVQAVDTLAEEKFGGRVESESTSCLELSSSCIQFRGSYLYNNAETGDALAAK